MKRSEKFRRTALIEVMTVVAEENEIDRRRIHFEFFTLDMRKRGLFRGQERIHLTVKPFETLIFLVENRGRIVQKQEILDAVWKDTFVTDDVLVQAVKEIRRVLEDNKDDPRFIQTVPRQGYRFVGDVSVELPFAATEIGEGYPLNVVPKRGHGNCLPRLPIFIALMCAAIIAVLVWFVWKPDIQIGPAGAPRTRSSTANDPKSLQHLPTGEFSAGKPAFSPDGKLILYVGSSRETLGYGDIFIMSASGGGSVRITEKASPSGDVPVFTADGSHVVFSRPRGGEEGSRLLDLYLVPSSGGEMKLYLPEASGAGFSTDGNWVAYTKHLQSQKVLWLSSTNNLDEHREIAVDSYTPRWSPNDKWLSYTTSNPNGGLGDVWIVDAETLSEPKNLTQEPQQIYGLSWSADSRSILFSSKRTGPHLIWQISVDDGTIEQVLTGIGESSAPSTSSDGNTLIFHHVRATKDLIIADGLREEDTQKITHDEYHQWLRFSPSGEKIVSVMQRPDFGEHLYVMDIKTRQSIRLSEVPARHPSWLDQQNVGYLWSDNAAAETKVQVVNVYSNVTTPLTKFSGLAEWLAIHPNKSQIAAVLTAADGKQKIILRDLGSNADQTIADGAQYSALRWLPDGSALSWSGPPQASTPASDGIWIYELDKRRVSQILNEGYGPVWSADGRSFYYSRNREFSGLWQFDLNRRQKKKIRFWKDASSFDLAGERLLYAEGDGRGQIYALKLNP
ncbi:MAG: winged helix-turn-helix domain-containing protein [Pyrinomonadaceae bacterium]